MSRIRFFPEDVDPTMALMDLAAIERRVAAAMAPLPEPTTHNPYELARRCRVDNDELPYIRPGRLIEGQRHLSTRAGVLVSLCEIDGGSIIVYRGHLPGMRRCYARRWKVNGRTTVKLYRHHDGRGCFPVTLYGGLDTLRT